MKPYTNERVDEAHEELLDFVRRRAARVAWQVQRELDRGILEVR
jgi:hypothetical protein